MIELSAAAAVVAVSGVAVAAAVWGAVSSVRSAVDGPEWALQHLKRVVPVSVAVAGLGVLTVVLVRPVWVGLTIVYVAIVVAWLTRRVARRLEVASQLGEFAPLPPDRQAEILRRTSRLLIGAGLIIVALGIADLAWRGWPALFDLMLAGALCVPGVIYLRRADRLLLGETADG